MSGGGERNNKTKTCRSTFKYLHLEVNTIPSGEYQKHELNVEQDLDRKIEGKTTKLNGVYEVQQKKNPGTQCILHIDRETERERE